MYSSGQSAFLPFLFQLLGLEKNLLSFQQTSLFYSSIWATLISDQPMWGLFSFLPLDRAAGL